MSVKMIGYNSTGSYTHEPDEPYFVFMILLSDRPARGFLSGTDGIDRPKKAGEEKDQGGSARRRLRIQNGRCRRTGASGVFVSSVAVKINTDRVKNILFLSG